MVGDISCKAPIVSFQGDFVFPSIYGAACEKSRDLELCVLNRRWSLTNRWKNFHESPALFTSELVILAYFEWFEQVASAKKSLSSWAFSKLFPHFFNHSNFFLLPAVAGTTLFVILLVDERISSRCWLVLIIISAVALNHGFHSFPYFFSIQLLINLSLQFVSFHLFHVFKVKTHFHPSA